jgi:hypothetical protein
VNEVRRTPPLPYTTVVQLVSSPLAVVGAHMIESAQFDGNHLRSVAPGKRIAEKDII